MNLYIIKSEYSPVKQVIAESYELAAEMYLNAHQDVEEHELDVNKIGHIDNCINGNYILSTVFPKWSEENRIEE